jgi:hypothetical protein
MRKYAAVFSLLAFVLFISATAYPSDKSANDFSLNKNKQGFSLSKVYEVNISSLELDSLKLRDAMLNSQDAKKAESLQAEIQHLKKRKKTNLLVTTGLIALGTFLAYEFANYEQGVRETQEGSLQEVDRGRTNISMGRGLRLGGSILSFIVSVVLINDTLKKGRAIKRYKKELEALSEAQGR